MSMNLVGVAAMFVGSEILGLMAGQWFYKLFLKTVPPLAMSSYNAGAAHLGFLWYGALFGFVIFLWALVTTFIGRLARTREIARPD